ncbi:MAG: transglycosylase family protein [Pseudonocardiaceae bacterium]
MTRHSRLLARTGLVAVALAIPLAIAAPAQAAVQTDWDQIANCESSGNWATDTGNGYSGGLQFTRSTWSSYGGTSYAPTAAQASRGQQITVAEKVLAGQGPGAWPVCSKRAGAS